MATVRLCHDNTYNVKKVTTAIKKWRIEAKEKGIDIDYLDDTNVEHIQKSLNEKGEYTEGNMNCGEYSDNFHIEIDAHRDEEGIYSYYISLVYIREENELTDGEKIASVICKAELEKALQD